MKRVTINRNEVGIVVKNNAPERILMKGKYWIGFAEQCEIYNLSNAFQSRFDINLLLQIEGFAECVHVVDVLDNEICVVFNNNIFKQVLASGRHIFWKYVNVYRFERYDISEIEIPASLDKQLLERQVLSYYIRNYKIDVSEKGLLFVDGVFTQILTSGNYQWWKNATTIAVAKADMRQTILEIVGQEILTKDKAQIRINFSCQYQVVDIVKCILENKDFEKQLYTLMQLALRSYIGQLTMDELMANKSEISAHILSTAAEQIDDLGVKVFNAGIKDIILPGDIRDIMNQVLVAEKKAQANIIMRREETASTRSLLNTAKLMEDNAMLFKLKEMEYVEKIADKINSISIAGNGQIVDQLKQLFVK